MDEATNPDDFLDEIVAERTKKNAHFPNLVEEAAARRSVPVKAMVPSPPRPPRTASKVSKRSSVSA